MRPRTIVPSLLVVSLLVACVSGDDGSSTSGGSPEVDADSTGEGTDPVTDERDDATDLDEESSDVADGSSSADAAEPATTDVESGASTNGGEGLAGHESLAVPTDQAATSRCDPDAVTEPTELLVWHGMSGDAIRFLEGLGDRFEEDHPAITVTFHRPNDGAPAALETFRAASDDELPDIVLGSNQTVRTQADSGRFVPVVECTDGAVPPALANLLPVVSRTYTVDGTLVAAPFNVSTPVMIFDAGRWRTAGVDPDDPPATYDDLLDTISQLAMSEEFATGAVLHDRSAMWLIEQAAAKEQRELAIPANGRSGPVTEFRFVNDDMIELLAALRDLKDDGSLRWLGANQWSTNDLLALVDPNDRTGFTISSSAVLGDVFRLIDSGMVPDVEVGVAPMPGPGPGGTVGGGAWWLVDTDDPATIGASWLFVDWITQPERIAELAAFTGYIPTTPAAASQPVVRDFWAERPEFQVGYEQLLASSDSDAGAGMQVGPLVDVYRQIELAVAFSIDVGEDPRQRLAEAERRSIELFTLYDENLARDPG